MKENIKQLRNKLNELLEKEFILNYQVKNNEISYNEWLENVNKIVDKKWKIKQELKKLNY